MRELNRTSPQTLAVQHELLLALLHKAQAAIGRQDLRWRPADSDGGPGFRQQSGACRCAWRAGCCRSRQTRRRTGQAAAAKARAPTPPRCDAKAAAAAVVLSPKPARTLQVDFPPLALARNVQGYAVVEFMLNPNGSASSPVDRRILAARYVRLRGAGRGQARQLLDQRTR